MLEIVSELERKFVTAMTYHPTNSATTTSIVDCDDTSSSTNVRQPQLQRHTKNLIREKCNKDINYDNCHGDCCVVDDERFGSATTKKKEAITIIQPGHDRNGVPVSSSSYRCCISMSFRI
jgi:hypothetical protein